MAKIAIPIVLVLVATLGAFLMVTKVEIHAADSTDNNGWQTITVSETIVDFATPTSVNTILGGASLPAGTYNMLRLFTDHATVSVNGVQRTLMIQSGDKTGI